MHGSVVSLCVTACRTVKEHGSYTTHFALMVWDYRLRSFIAGSGLGRTGRCPRAEMRGRLAATAYQRQHQLLGSTNTPLPTETTEVGKLDAAYM